MVVSLAGGAKTHPVGRISALAGETKSSAVGPVACRFFL